MNARRQTMKNLDIARDAAQFSNPYSVQYAELLIRPAWELAFSVALLFRTCLE